VVGALAADVPADPVIAEPDAPAQA
jgi:hypothetical protein